jgi:predicted Zn-dependent protease with MMP-like domain
MAYRVSKPLFGQLVEEALDELPPQFAEFLEQVPIEVRQQPTAAQLDSVGLRGQGLLLGLYQGRPLTRRSVEDSGRMPDVIYIFQDSIERVSNSERQLVEQVRKTVLHEIGHHFGMNEEDLQKLGYG